MDIWKGLDPGVYPWHPAPGNNLAHEYSNPLLISCPVATNTGIKQARDTACEFAVQR